MPPRGRLDMADKYRATIHGNTVEWEGEQPAELGSREQITVEIKVVDEPIRSDRPSSRRAVAALRRIADLGGVESIRDPAKWQREIRKDRRLPGR